MGLIGTPQLLDAEFNFDDSWAKSYKRIYRVFSTVDVDEDYVGTHLGITIFNTHPSNSRAIVRNINLKLESPNQGAYDSINNPGGAGSPPANGTPCYVWLATIDYGPWNPLEHTETGDPVDQPIQVFYEGITNQEPADVDKDGNPICNTAYDSFDPPIVRDKTRPVIRVIRNEASYSGFTVVAYADKVNNDAIPIIVGGSTVGTYPVRTLKCAAPRASPKFSQFTGNIYYEVEYQFYYDEKTWDHQPLDQGYNELDPSDATKRRKILVEGQPATTPVLLDGSGHALPPPVNHTSVNYLAFRGYDEIPFLTTFGFPTGTFT